MKEKLIGCVQARIEAEKIMEKKGIIILFDRLLIHLSQVEAGTQRTVSCSSILCSQNVMFTIIHLRAEMIRIRHLGTQSLGKEEINEILAD